MRTLAADAFVLMETLTACSDREARTFTVPDGRHVLSEAKPGDVVKCAGGGGATVPPPGQGVGGASSAGGSMSVETQEASTPRPDDRLGSFAAGDMNP